MIVGYARISTGEQNMDLQIDALKKAGCVKIFQDVCSGALDQRQGLRDAVAYARSGDSIAVWRLDRLGRSLGHLITTVNDLKLKNVGFRSLQETLDTESAGGKLVFHIFGALAEFERDLIRSRTRAGLAAARARGRIGGRPSKFDQEKRNMARVLLADQATSIKEVCRALQVSKATLYRNLKG
jgi:DNA invertase Pin-like site-specific DNA recombinase